MLGGTIRRIAEIKCDVISPCEIWWKNDELDWQVETSSIYKKKSGRTGGIGFIVIERC